MRLKYFYDEALAHASYLVGCQQAEVALIVDPGRDIDRYLEAAARQGMRITAVAETHIHADYVSGARELADRAGAKLYLSDAGPADWKYAFASQYDSELVTEGDHFQLGKLRFDVMHTPGHTPESISFLLTDEGGGADEPMGLFTGDFIFVGSIGRPDLLEEAAGVRGSAASGARDLFHSAQRFKALPDYLQIWPAHGAGSACGKGLGAIPSSTVGYEKRFNPALQLDNEEEFVRYILADQPEAPKYFAIMKRVNKDGPALLSDVGVPALNDFAQADSVKERSTLIDLRNSAEFREGHLPGAINMPLPMLASWAGWLVDYDRPVSLIAEPSQRDEAMRVLRKIGIDRVEAVFDADAARRSGQLTQRYPAVAASELAPRIASGDVALWDVRSDAEWNAGHVPQAEHRFLGRLPEFFDRIDPNSQVVVQCQAGARSEIAASLLQAAGFDVISMNGGYQAWTAAGLPTERPQTEMAAVASQEGRS